MWKSSPLATDHGGSTAMLVIRLDPRRSRPPPEPTTPKQAPKQPHNKVIQETLAPKKKLYCRGGAIQSTTSCIVIDRNPPGARCRRPMTQVKGALATDHAANTRPWRPCEQRT